MQADIPTRNLPQALPTLKLRLDPSSPDCLTYEQLLQHSSESIQ